MRKIIHFLLPFLLLYLLAGCSSEEQQQAASGKTIKIGVIGPVTGPDQALGLDSLEGIRTALHINPVLNNGDAVSLIVEDDRNDPELTVKAYKKLVDADEVIAVILLSTSGSALAVNAIADGLQVPVLVLLATHPDISKGTEFVSQICFDNTFQGKVAALFVRDELLVDRVAVFKDPDSSYSSSLADEFMRMFRSIEGQVTDVIPVSSEPVDYTVLLTYLRDQRVELLYLPLSAQRIIEIAGRLKEIGWSPQVMTGDNLLTSVLALPHLDPDLLEGFLTIESYSHTLKKSKYRAKVTEVFKSLYDTRTSSYAAAGFDGMAILIDAMNRCQQGINSGCVNNRIRHTVNFEGLMGKVTIQENGKAQRPLIVNRIQEQRLELVVKVY